MKKKYYLSFVESSGDRTLNWGDDPKLYWTWRGANWAIKRKPQKSLKGLPVAWKVRTLV